MTCNLFNHEKELKEAFDAVNSDKSGTSWCIFEYEGNSGIICLGNTGNNGIGELIENLNAVKVQYGFISLKSENQTKIVLIHWQGDGVPVIRRSQTAPHVTEVQRFVRSVHLTIAARTEEDIESSEIYKQLANSNAAVQPQIISSNSDAPIAPPKQSITPVNSNNSNGSSSKNTRAWVPPPPKTIVAMNPTAAPQHTTMDVNIDERTKFWQEMRAEEEQRRKEEAEKQAEQRKQYALERRQLEAQLHEALLAKNTAVAAQKRNGGVNIPQKKNSASDPIAGRRQIFEQKLAEIAATIPKPLTKPKNFKFQVGISKQHDPAVVQQHLTQDKSERLEQAKDGIETPNLSVKSVLQQFKQANNGQLPQQPEPQYKTKTASEEEQHKLNNNNNSSKQQDQASAELPTLIVQPMPKNEAPDEQADLIKQAEDISIEKIANTDSICVKALWDYQAEDDSEITFDPGDIITDVEMLHEGWWRGRAKNGIVGLFPSNFVEIL